MCKRSCSRAERPDAPARPRRLALSSGWVLLLALLVAAPALGDTPPESSRARAVPDWLPEFDPPTEPGLLGVTQTAWQYMKWGEHELAADTLRAAMATAQPDDPGLEEAWLHLIMTYVFRGNAYTLEPNQQETRFLWYKEAQRLIRECLQIRELRHLSPREEDVRIPPEMREFFFRIRAEMLGGIRIRKLTPEDAWVIFESDTLRIAPEDSVLDISSLPAGTYTLEVEHPKKRTLHDRIQVAGGAVTEKEYTLRNRRGLSWIARRAGPVAAGLGAAILMTRTPPGPPPEPVPDPADWP